MLIFNEEEENKVNIIKIVIVIAILPMIALAIIDFSPAESEPEKQESYSTGEKPGFEAVFAVVGLLAIAYLVLRQRE